MAVDLPGLACDVVCLLAVLSDTSSDVLFDVAGVDPGLGDQRLLHRPEQFGGVQAGQPAVTFTDGAAGGFDDDRITHAAQARTRFISLTSDDVNTPLVYGEGMFYCY